MNKILTYSTGDEGHPNFFKVEESTKRSSSSLTDLAKLTLSMEYSSSAVSSSLGFCSLLLSNGNEITFPSALFNDRTIPLFSPLIDSIWVVVVVTPSCWISSMTNSKTRLAEVSSLLGTFVGCDSNCPDVFVKVLLDLLAFSGDKEDDEAWTAATAFFFFLLTLEIQIMFTIITNLQMNDIFETLRRHTCFHF